MNLGITTVKQDVDMCLAQRQPKTGMHEYTFACSTFALISKPITITGFVHVQTIVFQSNCSHFLDYLLKLLKSVFYFLSCRHLSDKHAGFELLNTKAQSNDSTSPKPDYKFNYHQSKLVFGLLLRDFNDTVKEGDGEHLIDLYKLALLLYYSEKHTKYAYVVLLHLLKIVAILPEFEAHRLTWNRFYNKYGGRGNNISLDLKKEQQNKVLKTFWRSLGANINKENAARVAHALEPLESVMESVKKDCQYNERIGRRSLADQEESVQQIVDDLVTERAFHFVEGREGHSSFPYFDGRLIKDINYCEVHKWMTEHIKLWGSIYEEN